jgi:plastocyanin
MSIFKIQIRAGTPAVFDPNTLTVYVNDSVFWFNGDSQAHWPAPSAANPKGFLQYQVTPNASSNQVSFGTAKTISYICVNHPGETGQIIVKTPGKKKKGAFGGKTKKGAFGHKSKKGAFGGTTKR